LEKLIIVQNGTNFPLSGSVVPGRKSPFYSRNRTAPVIGSCRIFVVRPGKSNSSLIKTKSMENQATSITVENTVNAPVEKVWQFFTSPEHITKWNFASDDWQCPYAENDLRAGGKFLSRMEAKDGSFGFDFGGVYDEVIPNKVINYSIGDGRKVNILFSAAGGETKIITTFDAESVNPVEMQRGGWQAILNNFKKYTESGGH
jgi:uncharacterized protein YndB with AHSA1/START domain